MSRDNWGCVLCGATEMELQVHHIKYLPGKEPYDYPDHLLQTLCADCHHSETVVQTMSKFKISLDQWKSLEFCFRNVPPEKLDAFINRIFEISKSV